MTREQINTYLCAILSTLAETNGSPESMLYIGIGMDMNRWEIIRRIMLAGALVEISQAHYVTLTEKGKELAAKIDAALAR
jgi:predicted transcriptional regulator